MAVRSCGTPASARLRHGTGGPAPSERAAGGPHAVRRGVLADGRWLAALRGTRKVVMQAWADGRLGAPAAVDLRLAPGEERFRPAAPRTLSRRSSRHARRGRRPATTPAGDRGDGSRRRAWPRTSRRGGGSGCARWVSRVARESMPARARRRARPAPPARARRGPSSRTRSSRRAQRRGCSRRSPATRGRRAGTSAKTRPAK